MCIPQQDLSRLTDRLSKINESLSRKLAARNEFDNTIQETEAAYMKVRAQRQLGCVARVGVWRRCIVVALRAGCCVACWVVSPRWDDGLGRAVSLPWLVCGSLTHSRCVHCAPDPREFANTAARAQARERQPCEEEADVVIVDGMMKMQRRSRWVASFCSAVFMELARRPHTTK